MDSGISFGDGEGSTQKVDAACVETANHDGYEVSSRTVECAWVVCLDKASDNSCPKASEAALLARWIELSGDEEHPFGFKEAEGNHTDVLCAPSKPVDDKCCFVFAVGERQCL